MQSWLSDFSVTFFSRSVRYEGERKKSEVQLVRENGGFSGHGAEETSGSQQVTPAGIPFKVGKK